MILVDTNTGLFMAYTYEKVVTAVYKSRPVKYFLNDEIGMNDY